MLLLSVEIIWELHHIQRHSQHLKKSLEKNSIHFKHDRIRVGIKQS